MSAVNSIEENVERFTQFIIRRENLRIRKERGDAPPWTDDEILQEYRFCNIHREDDRVTRWIAENIRVPCAARPDLWLTLVMARLLNNVETLRGIQCVVGTASLTLSRIAQAEEDVLEHQRLGARVFNPAYMITTAGKKQDKVEYVFDLLRRLQVQRKRLRPKMGDTLNSYHMLLMMNDGLGGFLAAQVVADLKYVEPLQSATDWHTFAASGPGSRRGMNRVLGRAVSEPWVEDDWRLKLGKLRTKTGPMLGRHKIALHAQDLQNCLCEFDKYERARLGEGTPKQRYRTHAAD